MSTIGNADYSFAFTGATYNSYTAASTLAANQALARVKQKTGTKAASITSEQRQADAKAAGETVLKSLGIGGVAVAAAAAGLKTKHSSASGPYKAPTNVSTGYRYVQTSGANLSEFAALNIFA
jgi:hypothetical protein